MANKPVKFIFKKSAAIAFVLLFSIAAAALLINMLSFSNSRENADFEWGGYARKDEQWWGSPECVEIADEMIRHQRGAGPNLFRPLHGIYGVIPRSTIP